MPFFNICQNFSSQNDINFKKIAFQFQKFFKIVLNNLAKQRNLTYVVLPKHLRPRSTYVILPC